MKSLLLKLMFISGLLLLNQFLSGQTAGDYRSKQSGQWSLVSTWETYDGSDWINAAEIPDSDDGAITIRSPHTVTIDNYTASADQLLIQSGGTLQLTFDETINLNDGPGEDLICQGHLWLQRGIINGPGTVLIDGGATFHLIGGVYFAAGTLTTVVTNNGTIDWNNTCTCGGQTFWLNLTGGKLINNNAMNILCSTTASNTQVINDGEFINNGMINYSSPNQPNTFHLNVDKFIHSAGIITTTGKAAMTVTADVGSTQNGVFTHNGLGLFTFQGNAIQTYGIGSNFNGTGTFNFKAGTHTIEDGYNAAKTSITGATLNFNNGTLTLNFVSMTSGVFGGSANRTLSGGMDASNGTIAGSGTVTLPAGKIFGQTGQSATLSISNEFINNGTYNWYPVSSGTSNCGLNLTNGSFTNNGIFNVYRGTYEEKWIYGGSFINNGTFNRNAGPNSGKISITATCSLTNTGTLNFYHFNGSEKTDILGTKTLGGIINVVNGDLETHQLYFNGSTIILNQGAYIAVLSSNSHFEFTGSALQLYQGDGTGSFSHMKMNAPGGLDCQATIYINTKFTLTDGIVYIKDGNFVTFGDFIGTGSSTAYILTSPLGGGSLIRSLPNNSIHPFPVGTSSGFSPVDVKPQTAAAYGLYDVRVIDNVYSAYNGNLNGSPNGSKVTSAVVNRTWFIWKHDGTTVNTQITLKWQANSESQDFNNTNCRIAKYVQSTDSWTTETLGSGGSGPLFSRVSTNQTSLSTSMAFTVIGQFTTTTQSISPLCSGDEFDLNYKAIGTFNSGNVFSAQLSNASGDFSNPINIGSLTSTSDGTISCTIPSQQASGSGYRIRVISNNPNSIGSDNGSSIEITQGTLYYQDLDGDGFGNLNVSTESCDGNPAGYVTNSSDCDDNLFTYADHDNDGFGLGEPVPCGVGNNEDCNDNVTHYTDSDQDGYGVLPKIPCGSSTSNDDCNDFNGDIHPNANEICNDIDDDCDGLIDDADPSITGQSTWYADADGDGFGNANATVLNCNQPSGYVSIDGDCNDSNANVHPNATEICNGIDDDCDGLTDDSDPGITGQSTWFADNDGDGFGDPSDTELACNQPSGYVSNDDDCDDSNANVNPNAVEICNDIDDDCDGLIDDADPSITGQSTWYADADGDGFGNENETILACNQPSGYVANDDDCDDSNANVNPNAVEICNGIDDDCDGLTDDNDTGITGQSTWFADNDGDGFGDPSDTELACNQPSGYVSNDDDCDDSNANVNPNAVEICNGMDDDCDGLTDDNDPGITGQSTWFADNDGDGFGDPSDTELACNQPSGYVSNDDDCNDNNASIHPNATEICNDIDDDCDGNIDEGLNCDDDMDGDGIPDEDDNCPSIANPDQEDADCDGVGDVCDLCPGGDDSIDNNNDGLPDCHYLPAYADIVPAWKCGNNKVYVAHGNGNGGCNSNCVSYNSAQSHINHGDYLGQCNHSNCGGSLKKKLSEGHNQVMDEIEYHSDVLHLAAFHVSVSPNPFTNETILKIDGNSQTIMKVSVLDAYGTTIEILHSHNGEPIRLGKHYTPGMYLVNITVNGEQKMMKIIKGN